MGAGETQTGTGGAEGPDSGVARPGSDLRQIACNAAGFRIATPATFAIHAGSGPVSPVLVNKCPRAAKKAAFPASMAPAESGFSVGPASHYTKKELSLIHI